MSCYIVFKLIYFIIFDTKLNLSCKPTQVSPCVQRLCLVLQLALQASGVFFGVSACIFTLFISRS